MIRKINTPIRVGFYYYSPTIPMEPLKCTYNALSQVVPLRANECFRCGVEIIAPSTEFIERHIYEITNNLSQLVSI